VRRFRTDRYRCKHESPIKPSDMRLVRNLVEGKVRDITQHDTKGSPHLPHHDETTSDGGRGTFGRINGDRRGLWADTQSKEEASNEEMGPRVGDSLPNTGQER